MPDQIRATDDLGLRQYLLMPDQRRVTDDRGLRQYLLMPDQIRVTDDQLFFVEVLRLFPDYIHLIQAH